MSTQQPSVTVYAAGGAAINIVAPLLQGVKGDNDQGFAEINYTLIDTSLSNVQDIQGAREFFYKIEGRNGDITDGSGLVRKTNLPAVRAAVPEILAKFPPGDLSIVVSSASGGSGSVISPVIVTELLSQGKNVIVIAIGATTSAKHVNNTIDTLESFQRIAETRERPVVCYYVSNSDAPISHNDQQARKLILLLAAIWSGKNNGLDRKDLENFLNYQNVTNYPIGVVGLELRCGTDQFQLIKGQPVSTAIALVASKDDDHGPGIPVGYHSYGVFSAMAGNRLSIDMPIHLFTVQGWFVPVLYELYEYKKQGEEHYRVHPVDVVKTTRAADDDGLIV